MTHNPETTPRALLADIARFAAAIAVLTVVLGVGIVGVGGGLASAVPQTEFGYEYDAATETLRVVHAGGDAVAATALRIEGAPGRCGPGEWGDGLVRAGDACTLQDVPDRARVRIDWASVGGPTAVLDVWIGPAA